MKHKDEARAQAVINHKDADTPDELTRWATERAYDQGFTEGRRTGNIQLAEQLKSEREARERAEAEVQRMEDAWMQDETISGDTLRPSVQKTVERAASAEKSLSEAIELLEGWRGHGCDYKDKNLYVKTCKWLAALKSSQEEGKL